MTVKDMIEKALKLLGYSDVLGNTSDPRFQVSSKVALNMVYADLFYKLHSDGFSELDTLDKKIPLPERVLNDVMPYGVAAYIAESLGDGEKQQFFALMYNRKRISVVKSDTVKDVLPVPEG